MITNRYGFANKGGFLMSRDVIMGIVVTELMWATWNDFDINRVDETNEQDENLTSIENSYLTFVWKIVSLRVRTQINLERPSSPVIKKPKKQKLVKSIVDDYYDRKFDKEYGEWNNDDYDDQGNKVLKPGEVLFGSWNELERLSDEIQESRWNSNYGNDFKEIEENYKFDDIFEGVGLTENQIDVIVKIYKEQHTFNEIGQMNGGITKQSVNDTKKAALKKLKKKFENM
jgi:predicted DNA-binding protein YlxM (UPF0122 family)